MKTSDRKQAARGGDGEHWATVQARVAAFTLGSLGVLASCRDTEEKLAAEQRDVELA